MTSLNLPKPLAGEGFSLRLLRRADAAAIAEICQDPDIQRFTGLPSPFSRQDAEDYLARTESQAEAGTGAAFAVLVGDDSEIAGCAGLHHIRPYAGGVPATASVRVWLDPGHRRSGLATRVLRTIAAWAFDDLGLERLTAYYLPENEISRRLMQSVGFTNHGLLRSVTTRDDVPADLGYSDLLSSELKPA